MARPFAAAAILALCLAAAAGSPRASGEEPPPAPAPADEAARRAEEDAVAARARAAEAAREADRAEERARRARRRALEDAIRAAEAEQERLRDAGEDDAAVALRLRGLYADLAAAASAEAGRAAPVARPVPAAGTPRGPAPDVGAVRRAHAEAAAAGLPPLVGRPADAVHSGECLDWLARHQSPAGPWDADGFSSACTGGRCPGPGGPLYDPGATGLALLAFLGAGETHKTPRYGHVVRGGLKYLKGIQDAEGCFGPRTSNHFTYNHALATLAMALAYGRTQSPLFRDSARAGVDFALTCQNPYLGWRYGVRPQDNDTAVTGWMVFALRTARDAGLEVDEGAFTGAVAWLDKVTEPEFGRAGYTARGNGPARPQELMDAFPADRSEAMTAEAVFARLLCGQGAGEEPVRKGADLCLRTAPRWDVGEGTIDLYYWYFGTLAMARIGGDSWKRWDEALGPALAAGVRGEESGCARGSVDPLDPWGNEGGRVVGTALAALALQVREDRERGVGGK